MIPVQKSPHITEPERLEIKQRHVSHDSDEKPPKAKARVMTKKQKVQLPGHQNPIEVPTVKPPNDDEDDVPNPTAASSNDPTIPCRRRHHIRSHRHSRKMKKNIIHHNPVRIPFLIKILRRKSLSSRKMKLNT